jgi:hypothetical protein
MNIFFTSSCPVESAKFLDTKRVNKMILESAQLLSTALRENGYEGDGIYKATHRNHPSNIWARQSKSNYIWLLKHFKALAEEYYSRRSKWHKSYTTLYNTLADAVSYIPEGDLTPFANCAAREDLGISYKHLDDVHVAYQLYLNERWDLDKKEPVWT